MRKGWVCVAALAAALAAGSGAGTEPGGPGPGGGASVTGGAAPYPRETPIVRAVKKTRAAVVKVRVEKRDGAGRSREMGAGVVVDERGYVVTNSHLVRSAHREGVRVQLADSTELPATVVAEEPGCDLAVLRVRADRPLFALPLGPGSDLEVGETVIAIGHPHGYTHTVSTGIISALGRRITMPTGEVLTGLIQTNAGINPGSSGGPLLNINGELIGLNAAYEDGAQGIGFAVNADTVKAVLCRHLSGAKVAGVCHGLTCTERVQPDGPHRQQVHVAAVGEQTPAARAGLRTGDEIRAVDGRPMVNPFDLERAVWDHKAGDRIGLTVVRQGQTRTVGLTLAAAGDSTHPAKLALAGESGFHHP
jgi:serine protease Do